MQAVAIVYWSGTGNTQAMAEAVAEGVRGAGGEAVLLSPAEFDAAKAGTFEVLAFGCPAMGAEELEEEEFAPMFEGCAGALKGKRLGLFGSYGWGDGEWMRSWEDTCRQAGAVLVSPGVICCEAPDEEALSACKALGRALAEG